LGGPPAGLPRAPRAARPDRCLGLRPYPLTIHRATVPADRPFRILGLQQVAIGGLDKQNLRALWTDLLGVPTRGSYRSEQENVDEDILLLGHGANEVELDLMQPIDPEARPRVHEPALNHIGLWVDDLRTAVAWLEQRGVRFTPGGIRKGAAGHDVCFIHPKGSATAPVGGQGVLIELVQAPAEVIAASQPTASM
jgi:lactoylglutathione lyase